MATSFLRLVAGHIRDIGKDKPERICVVLPNRRASVFLKKHLAGVYGKTIWLPSILSAEEFAAGVSGLSDAEDVDLVCSLYESYRFCYGNDAEAFESFARWGQLMLQDFNEVDRAMADPAMLYDNLHEIRVVESWSLGAETLTENQSRYLRFMRSMGAIYRHFTDSLLTRGQGTPGLIVRTAAGRCGSETFTAAFDHILFCGFNALNTAEERLFGYYSDAGRATFLWDADLYYLSDPDQEAGMFLRRNFKRFHSREQVFIQQNFLSPKSVRIITVPGQTGQAQVVRQEIERLVTNGTPSGDIAVVLANERLLWPVLEQLPPAITGVNVTMGYPLRFSATFAMAEIVLRVHLGYERQPARDKTIYHKDLLALMRQPVFADYLRSAFPSLNPSVVIRGVTRRNLAFINERRFLELFGDHSPALAALLRPLEDARALVAAIARLLKDSAAVLGRKPGNRSRMELEFTWLLLKSFNRIAEIVTEESGLNNVASLRQLFQQVAGAQSVNFTGEPLEGLQIMGVLETRCLDFPHVILVNANEGVLPAGRSGTSFIPNDLKKAFGLPLYHERDAIYAYHFYRLLQRTESATITCDSETDTFGKGERSRFVTQLTMELPKYNRRITIEESVGIYENLPDGAQHGLSVRKSPAVLKPVTDKAGSRAEFMGLSPSALMAFKECGLQFYFRYGARIREADEVEESAEAGSFGSILHLGLENLYKPFAGKSLTEEGLLKSLAQADAVVAEAFRDFFDGNPPFGKSLLQEEVIRVYVKKLLNRDLRHVRRSVGEIRLLELEKEFAAPLNVMIGGETMEVFIKGKIDRIDRSDGSMRLIDYKSSVRPADKFKFAGFEPLFTDRNYNKQFQLLCYAWLLWKSGYAKASELKPAIIPFREFAEEPAFICGPDGSLLIMDDPFLCEFERHLSAFIAAIFDESEEFVQTDDEEVCGFCAYNTVCHRQN